MEAGKEFFRYIATLGALAMCVSCPLLPPALGQASVSGRISGTVTDVTGAVIRAAQVRARNLTTNDQRSTVSGDLGIYEFLNVPIGRYELAIEAPGFKKEVTEVEVQVFLRSFGLKLRQQCLLLVIAIPFLLLRLQRRRRELFVHSRRCRRRELRLAAARADHEQQQRAHQKIQHHDEDGRFHFN